MSRKKKILLFVIGFFTLHALTWWVWGTERLLVKGYEYLEGTEMCSPEIDGKVLFQETYEDTTYSYIGERLWSTSISGMDTVFTIQINGIERTVYSRNSERRRGLLEEYHSGNINFRVNLVEQEFASPYYQNAAFVCWAFGSDWYEDHKPFLIWAFFGWIEITDEQTVAKLINRYRD